MSILTDWICSKDALFSLADEWRRLWDAAGRDNPFLAPDWSLHWFDAFAGAAEPAAITARCARSNALLGFAPLARLGRDRNTLGFAGSGIAAPDHLDFLLVRERENDIADAMLKFLFDRKSEWDRLDLDGLDQGSVIARKLRSSALYLTWQRSRHTCPFMPLPDSFEAYLQSMPSKRRRRQGWRKRRLEKEFPDAVRFRSIATQDELPNAMESLFRLHQAAQTSRGNAGSFATDEMRRLHLSLAETYLAQQALRLHVLTVDDKDIAAIYCFRHGATVRFYSIGYDDAFSNHNPGRQIMAHSIEEAIREGAAEYDFLRGDEDYKSAFTEHFREDSRLLAAARSGPRLKLAAESFARQTKRAGAKLITRSR